MLSITHPNKLSFQPLIYSGDMRTNHTLGLFDNYRFSETRSSRASIIDSKDPEVIVCSFSEACHCVC